MPFLYALTSAPNMLMAGATFGQRCGPNCIATAPCCKPSSPALGPSVLLVTQTNRYNSYLGD